MLTASVFAAGVSSVRQAAFNTMVANDFPMTPAEIHEFKNIAAQQEEANAQMPGDSSIGTSNVIPVTLTPGGIMPVVRIGQGMITSLVFMDASGKIWPIVSYTIGDPAAFNVSWDKKSGVLMVQGKKLYAETNMGVMLQGMQIPIMLNLMIGQKHWDYLDYIRIAQNQLGQDGQVEAVKEAPSFLNNVLMGIPPAGAAALQTSSADVQMWAYRGDYLLLTRGTLLSPAWRSRVSSAGNDPYHAYVLPGAPVILLSNQGQVESIKVSEEPDND